MAGAGSAGTGKIRVKFLVDNEKRKVVFAESGKEFVDVLLSFLTLPLGTIVRLLGKESSLGCFDELYRSVESLDASHFQTKACRNMLLRPLSAAGEVCEDLIVRIDDTDTGGFGVADIIVKRTGEALVRFTIVQFQMCHASSVGNPWNTVSVG